MIALKAVFPVISVILYAAVICKPTRLRASTPTPLVAGVLPLGSSGVQARFPRGSPRAGPDDGIAQRGRPWVRVGEAENLEVVRFSVTLSIVDDTRWHAQLRVPERLLSSSARP